MGKQTFKRTKETLGILLLVFFTVVTLTSWAAAAEHPDDYNCTTTTNTVCKCPCPFTSGHQDSGYGDQYNRANDNQQKCCNNGFAGSNCGCGNQNNCGCGGQYNCANDNQQKCCNKMCDEQKNNNDFHDHDMFNCFNNL